MSSSFLGSSYSTTESFTEIIQIKDYRVWKSYFRVFFAANIAEKAGLVKYSSGLANGSSDKSRDWPCVEKFAQACNILSNLFLQKKMMVIS